MDLSLLDRARKGNADERNKFIEMNKKHIHRYACLICKRYLTWENDDELSIALMAFNSAIDSYKEGNFEAYSKLIIKSRLIDYFRKNSKNDVPIDDNILEIHSDCISTVDERLDRITQINIFKERIESFNISLEDLTKKSPKHRDTREKLINIARETSQRSDIVDKLNGQKMLPVKDIVETTSVSRKMIEEWRKYLIALIIIFSDKRLDTIKDFIL